jgi:glycosyltransferase involved in cell wall biosynthesis
LIFIGRFNEQKNLFSLFEAIDGSDINLTMVGGGELEEQLKNAAEKLKNTKVQFLGKVKNSELPALIASHQIFILPSFYEGNQEFFAEAMSCSAAIICSANAKV